MDATQRINKAVGKAERYRSVLGQTDLTFSYLLLQQFHMQCLWLVIPVTENPFLSLAWLLDNASPYLPLRCLHLITCVLVGDNVGIGFLVRRVAPSGENEEGNELIYKAAAEHSRFLNAVTQRHAAQKKTNWKYRVIQEFETLCNRQ